MHCRRKYLIHRLGHSRHADNPLFALPPGLELAYKEASDALLSCVRRLSQLSAFARRPSRAQSSTTSCRARSSPTPPRRRPASRYAGKSFIIIAQSGRRAGRRLPSARALGRTRLAAHPRRGAAQLQPRAPSIHRVPGSTRYSRLLGAMGHAAADGRHQAERGQGADPAVRQGGRLRNRHTWLAGCSRRRASALPWTGLRSERSLPRAAAHPSRTAGSGADRARRGVLRATRRLCAGGSGGICN